MLKSATTLQIVSGSSVVKFDGLNKFTYQLPARGYQSSQDEVALKSLTMYYSWTNISAARGNNQFSYFWPGDNLTHPVVLADGIWQFSEINLYLQQVMRSRGHYLIDSLGDPVYFINFIVNSVMYCLSLTVTPLPNILPNGWSDPSASCGPAAGRCPQLIIPAALSTLTGFAAGSYPAAPQTSLYQVNSGVPQITDITAINVVCNLCDNQGFSLNQYILSSFTMPSSSVPGTLVTVQPFQLDWVPVQRGFLFDRIEVSFTDQLGRPITLRDPAGAVMTLQLRPRQQ